MEPWTLIIQVLALLLLFYYYIKRRWSFWSKRGVPHASPPLHTLGINVKRLTEGPEVYSCPTARQFGKVYGQYALFRPELVVNHVDLIKQIMIKDFPLFVNKPLATTWDDLWNLNLFIAEEHLWRGLRRIASPTFTAGKLRSMRERMNRCVGKLSTFLADTLARDGAIVDVKEILLGFTIEVISITNFATETNINSKEGTFQGGKGRQGGNSRQVNPFVEHGIGLFQFDTLKSLSVALMPRWWNSALGIRSAFTAKHFDFFGNMFREIVKQRKAASAAGGPRANDFAQLLIDAYVPEETPTKSGGARKQLTDTEIVAQCYFLFTAGFETTSSTLTYLLYELTQNADIQERLVDELASSLAGLEVNSEQYYESVMSHCPYLEATIKETLRKYPPVVRLERRVGVDGYKLGGIELKKDMSVIVNTWAVHHDPDYYPQPERFNPERFLPENKHLLLPYAFLPFGLGPRNCLGMRFAYQEMKLLLSQLIRQFAFESTPETPTHLTFKGSSLFLSSQPFKIKVSARN